MKTHAASYATILLSICIYKGRQILYVSMANSTIFPYKFISFCSLHLNFLFF